MHKIEPNPPQSALESHHRALLNELATLQQQILQVESERLQLEAHIKALEHQQHEAA
jgi:hypothetical protein